jgi:hypothetical protein
MKALFPALLCAAFASVSFAGVGTLPGATLDTPGSKTVGAPEGTDPTTSMYVDANGDGLIQRAEVKPGTQLAKRFDTRDKNHDGVLSSDEYYVVH